MQGYWRAPAATAAAITQDGFLLTGDLGFRDAQGFIKIVDRKKDMILVSGFNVYPNEVEDAIDTMDEVLEVAVIGVPDDKTGEAVRAYIVPQRDGLTEEAVRAHCKRLLADYKLPRSVVLRKELPKTPIGKILRKDLKAELGLSPAASAPPQARAGAQP